MMTGYQKLNPGRFGRIMLVQIIPFVLMLVVGSWLTLEVGQLIDQQRGPGLNYETAQVHLSRF